MRGSARDVDKLASANRAKRIKNDRHSRQKIRKSVRLCGYQDDSDFASLKALLVLHSSVKRQKDLKARLLREREQFSVLLPRPTGLRNSVAFMSRQMILEFSGKTLVEQQFHFSWLTTRALACSSA